jgi:hypothetical protein
VTNRFLTIPTFEPDSRSKWFNLFLSLVHNRGKRLHPGWNGSIAYAGFRTGALFAALLVSVVVPCIGQTAGYRIAEPAQTSAVAERDQAESNANASEDSVAAAADPEREAWHQAMLNIPRPAETCSAVSYPEQQWREVPCETAPDGAFARDMSVRPEIVGGIGLDLTFVVANGTIAEGEGSFDKVTGVTSEDSNGVRNSFSLQLNTNVFTTKTCGSHKGCQGWVQFIYDSSKPTPPSITR